MVDNICNKSDVLNLQDKSSYLCIFILDGDKYYFIKSKLMIKGNYNYLPIIMESEDFDSAEAITVHMKRNFIKCYQIEPEIFVSNNYYSLCPIMDIKFYPVICKINSDESKDFNNEVNKWCNLKRDLEDVSISNMGMCRNENYFFDVLLRELENKNMGQVGKNG